MKKLLPLCLLALLACARPIAPTGGPRDAQPPGLLPEKSTPNRSTFFAGDRIELTFDEWVTLSDVGKQVLISPPLSGKKNLPDISLKGKTVTIQFEKDQVLRPKTTYTINMGQSVKDLHEGNPAKDLIFVFSTGAYIDSLIASGTVVDAFTLKPVEQVVAMLYENTADSAVLLERPAYFARSDKSGAFQLTNLKPGTYRLVVVEDNIPNLRWDGPSERIGFMDTLLVVGDPVGAPVSLQLFQQEQVLRIQRRDTSGFGQVRLQFTGPVQRIPISCSNADITLLPEFDADSITIWHSGTAGEPWYLLAGVDTIRVPTADAATFREKHRLHWPKPPAPTRTFGRQPAAAQTAALPTKSTPVSQNAARPAKLLFNAPVVRLDTARWILLADTTPLRSFDVQSDSLNPRRLLLNTRWTSDTRHDLYLLPGAVTDIWGTSNADTLQASFNAGSTKTLSALVVELTGLNIGASYTLEVLDGEQVVERRAFRAAGNTQKCTFTGLPATAYTLRRTDDLNGNGRWDPGHYLEKRQPEPIRTRPLEALQAGWEVSVTW
jgi:uncharacterized protein (DUF2141 family)